VAGDNYNRQSERVTTFVFPEIEGVLQAVWAKLFIMIIHLTTLCLYPLKIDHNPIKITPSGGQFRKVIQLILLYK